MKASEVLKNEHRGIERMLTILEREADRLEAGEAVPAETIEQAVDFLRNFADGCHHFKEEQQLFPALEKAGVPVDQGPIGMMLADHVEGRRYIAAMASALDPYRRGEVGAAAALATSSRNYTALLRGHIWKEDNVLFAMADRVLPEPVQAELIASFDRIEEEHMGVGVHERYHQMLDDLERAA